MCLGEMGCLGVRDVSATSSIESPQRPACKIRKSRARARGPGYSLILWPVGFPVAELGAEVRRGASLQVETLVVCCLPTCRDSLLWKPPPAKELWLRGPMGVWKGARHIQSPPWLACFPSAPLQSLCSCSLHLRLPAAICPRILPGTSPLTPRGPRKMGRLGDGNPEGPRVADPCRTVGLLGALTLDA